MEKISLAVLYSMVFLFQFIRGLSWRKRKEKKEIKERAFLRRILGILQLVVLGLYLLTNRLDWTSVELPSWVKIVGVMIYLGTFALYVQVVKTMGKSWSGKIAIGEKHRLVTEGWYHYVRHPSYTLLYGYVIATFLITGNLTLLAISLAFTHHFTLRAYKEEMLLIEEFGYEYVSYMDRTGMFLPRLRAG